MALITQREIVEAFERLGQLAEAQGEKISLVLAGGALMVLAYDARQSTRDVDAVILAPSEAREEVWKEVEPYLVPGSELKAQYAFLDLWETLHGND